MRPRRRETAPAVRSRSYFAVRGVLRYTYAHPPDGRADVFYELRIVVVRAKTEDEARRSARRIFLRYEGTDRPERGVSLKIEYLGISKVCELVGDPGEDGEVWWEFVDERPSMERMRSRKPRVIAPRARSATARPGPGKGIGASTRR